MVNLSENSGKFFRFNIQQNVFEDSMECTRRFWERSKRFWGIFNKILLNVINDSKKCLRRFQGMLLKILGSVIKDSE